MAETRRRRHCGCICPEREQGVCVLPWGHTGAHVTAWRREESVVFGRRYVSLKRWGWGEPLTWQDSDLFVNYMHLREDEATPEPRP